MQNFHASPDAFKGDTVVLDGAEYLHATRVCRVRAGEVIGVTDGRGRRVEARVEMDIRGSLTARIVRDMSGAGEPEKDITLALALIKPQRFEIAAEKCTELGVRRIIPVKTDRCEPDGLRFRSDRIARIVLEAAKQSGRSWIPDVEPPADIGSVCERGGILLAAVKGAARRVGGALGGVHAAERVTVLIGPEGDFTVEETALMTGRGAVPVSLGGLTLRSETAAITAIALVREFTG